MTKTYAVFFAVLCILVFSLSAACAESENTLLIYMIGSDLESKNGYASDDLQEMMEAYPADGKLDILVCAGGTSQWHNNLSANGPVVYRLTNQGMERIWVMPQTSMAESQTLKAFLDYAEKNTNSPKALLFWNHGGGPLVGFGYDENDKENRLLFSEIQEALAHSFAQREKLNWIGFDACLMGSMEIAALVEPYAEYLIASEEVEMGCGWDYRFINHMTKGLDTPELARIILESYYETTVAACGGDAQMMPTITLACYDMKAYANLAQSMNALAEKMDVSLLLGSFTSLAKSRSAIPNVGRFSGGLNTDLVDLKRLFQAIQIYYPQEVQAAQEALQSTIISFVSNSNSICGMSVYFPYYDKAGYVSGMDQLYQNLMPLQQYKGFVDSFADAWIAGTSKHVKPPEASLVSELSVLLDEELLNTMTKAIYLIAQEVGSNGYGLYYIGDNISIEENVLTANYHMETLYVIHADERFPVFMMKMDEDEQHCWYEVPVFVSRIVEDVSTEDFMKLLTLQVVLEKETNQSTVIGAYAHDDEKLGKQQIDLSQWDTIQFLFYGYDLTYSQNGELLPLLNCSNGSVYGIELDLSTPFQIEMAPIEGLDSNLYCQFVIGDVYGNQYASDLILVQQGEKVEMEDSIDTERLIWEDQTKPLLLADNELMSLWLQTVDKEKGSLFTLLVENKTANVLRTNLNDLALNGVMLDNLGYCEIPSQSKAEWIISTTNYPFCCTATEMFSLLQMRCAVMNENDSSMIDPIYVEVELEWPFTMAEQNEYPSDFHVIPEIIWEDEEIRITAENLSFLPRASSAEVSLVFQINNKTDDIITAKMEAAYLNDWMLSSLPQSRLLPNTRSFVEVRVAMLDLLASGDNRIGTLWSCERVSSFFTEKRYSGIKETTIVPKEQNNPETYILPWGVITDVHLYRSAEKLDISFVFENTTENYLRIEDKQLLINQQNVFGSLFEEVLPGKKVKVLMYVDMKNETILPQNEEGKLEVVIRAQDIQTSVDFGETKIVLNIPSKYK